MTSETVVQQQVRLTMARAGAQMWRNNVGACVDETGRMIRYGLANESAQLNRQIKSSDLIGIMPIVIQPHHVGKTVGVFTALEVKHSGWHMTPGDQRACAQARFHDIVRMVGGFAGFVTDPQDLSGIFIL